MKKYLLLMAAGIFGILTANAWTVSQDGSKAIITGNGSESDNWSAISSADQAIITAATTLEFHGTVNTLKPFESHCGNATTVDFSNATFPETPDGTITYEAWDPQQGYHTATVQKTKNCMTFSIFPNVSTAKLASVKTLCQNLFSNNMQMKTTFEIPRSVEVIAGHAVDDTPIKSIFIPKEVKYIEYQAFQNADIKALIDVTVEGYTYAHTGAFDKQTTVGQTRADYPDYATLHFPEGADEYFVNMDDQLDQATSLNKGKFQAWLDNHYSAAATCSNPNGWKEFINAGGGTPEKPTKEVVLRTYSSDVARIVPTGFRAYLVTGVTEANVSGKKQYTLKLQQIFAIPANTGVILYGEVKDKTAGYVLTKIPYWSSDPSSSDYVAPYNRETGIINDAEGTGVLVKNYMVPTVKATKIYPFYKDMEASDWTTIWSANPPTSMVSYYTGKTDKKVTDRNFIMTNFQSTTLKDAQYEDFVGFFRVKVGVTCGPEKAYLSLPYDMFKSAAGAEALVVKPESPADMKFRYDVWNNNISTGNWGQRNSNIGVLQSKIAGEAEEDDVTGISNVSVDVEEDGDYYTLQGVKVAQPQKGVYIQNGKKVIIK